MSFPYQDARARRLAESAKQTAEQTGHADAARAFECVHCGQEYSAPLDAGDMTVCPYCHCEQRATGLDDGSGDVVPRPEGSGDADALDALDDEAHLGDARAHMKCPNPKCDKEFRLLRDSFPLSCPRCRTMWSTRDLKISPLAARRLRERQARRFERLSGGKPIF